MKSKTLLSLIIACFTCNVANAQLLTFAFGVTNTSTCVTDGNTPMMAVTNATATSFSRTGSSSFTCDSYNGFFNTKGWNQTNTIDYSQYLEITVTASPGYQLNISGVTFTAAKSSTGPITVRIAHNASGNFTTNYYDFLPVTNSSNTNSYNWNSFPNFSTASGGSVKFRIYGWGATSSLGTFRIGAFAVNGAVTPVSSGAVLSQNDSIADASATLRDLPIAIRLKDTLGLSSVQLSALLKGYDSIKTIAASYYAQNPTGRFRSKLLEAGKIQSILTQSQYILLLNVKSRAWKSGTLYGNNILDQPIPYTIDDKDTLSLTQSQINSLLLSFDSVQQAAIAFKISNTNPAAKFDNLTPQYNSLRNVLSAQQYSFLKEIKFKDNFKSSFTSQFALAIKYKDTLGLSSAQVTSITLAADTLKNTSADSARLHSAVRFDGRAFESSRLNYLLTSQQYTLLLQIKNKAKAKVFASNDWNEMQLRGIAVNYNQDSAIIELTNYYIARESIYNRYQHDKIRQNQLIQLLYASKPAVLNALYHARRNPDNNTQGQGYNWNP